MNPGFSRLLDQVVPEPVGYLDADRVLGAARRRQRRRRLASATALGALAVTLALPLLSLAGSGGGDDAPPAASALTDLVPLGEVARGALDSEGPLAQPGGGTLVGVVGDDEIWSVERADGGLCLLSVNEKYGSAATSCQPRRDLATDGIVLATQGVRPDGPLLLVVAVPGAYTTVHAGAASATVQHQVAVLAFDPDEPPAGAITASGPGQPDLSYSLGGRVPAFGSAHAPATDALAGAEAAARRTIADLVRRADAYSQAHGSTEGFAASLSEAEPGPLDGLQSLSDTVAIAAAGDRCQKADLTTGTVFEDVPC